MKKTKFSPEDWFHLTELAHAAVLSGLVSARRWKIGDLKFQGGTSLHLVYGSPRFSEDLDFVTASANGLKSVMQATSTHVQAAFRREFPSITATLKVRDEEEVADPRNPRLFTLTLAAPDWHQSLKVKVEFFIADKDSVGSYQSSVLALRPLRPKLRVDIPPVQLETAELEEILVDKLHALGDRDRLKERDVFDLQWVCSHLGFDARRAADIFVQRHDAHLRMYPDGKALPELSMSLRERAVLMHSMLDEPVQFDRTRDAIVRWLPASKEGPNPLASDDNVRAMVRHAAACADATAASIDALLDEQARAEIERLLQREKVENEPSTQAERPAP